MEEFDCIVGRYKEKKGEKIDGFVLRLSWFTYGIFAGLLIAGIIAGFTI